MARILGEQVQDREPAKGPLDPGIEQDSEERLCLGGCTAMWYRRKTLGTPALPGIRLWNA